MNAVSARAARQGANAWAAMKSGSYHDEWSEPRAIAAARSKAGFQSAQAERQVNDERRIRSRIHDRIRSTNANQRYHGRRLGCNVVGR
ncbi:hypothetical protein MTO96_035642 [Rhipicephalus appendiculatus]